MNASKKMKNKKSKATSPIERLKKSISDLQFSTEVSRKKLTSKKDLEKSAKEARKTFEHSHALQ
jgi:hypothetical protein